MADERTEAQRNFDRTLKRLLLLIVPILALLCAEFVLRVGGATGAFGPWVRPEQDAQYVGVVMARHVIKAQAMDVPVGPNLHFPINSRGYRGPEFADRPASDTVRIVFYGGSQVFDIGATGNADWPHRVEALLRARGLAVEVINAGIAGHASFDCVGRLLTEGHLWHPDIVVLDAAWNDMKYFRNDVPLLRSMTPMTQGDPRTTYHGPIDKALCRISRLYTTARLKILGWWLGAGSEGVVGPVRPPADHVDPRGLAQYRLNVATFVALAQRAGAMPVLMTQPRLMRLDATPAMQAVMGLNYVGLTLTGVCDAYAAVDRTLREVAAAERCPLLDAARGVPSNLEHFVDGVHTTRIGEAVLAKVVAEGLAEHVARRLANKAAGVGAPN